LNQLTTNALETYKTINTASILLPSNNKPP